MPLMLGVFTSRRYECYRQHVERVNIMFNAEITNDKPFESSMCIFSDPLRESDHSKK